MLEALTLGLATGFALSWTFGTVFFMLIQTSIRHGYRKGFYIASGVVATDLIFILISLLGISLIDDMKSVESYLGSGGGFILLIWGLINLFRKSEKQQEETDIPDAFEKRKWKNSTVYFILLGALLNSINPVNIFSWIFVSTTVFPSYSHSVIENFVFYTVCLGMILGCECLVSYFAYSMKKWYTPRLIYGVKITTSVVFMGLGLYLLNNYIFKWDIQLP